MARHRAMCRRAMRRRAKRMAPDRHKLGLRFRLDARRQRRAGQTSRDKSFPCATKERFAGWCLVVSGELERPHRRTAYRVRCVALAFCGAPLGAIRGSGPSDKRGEHRRGDRILSRASRLRARAHGNGPATRNPDQPTTTSYIVTVIIKGGGGI